MVHIGRPSRGCAVCRKRRIKCDEKEPECSYCMKTKQTCPGYKAQFDLAWRDQTSVAQKNVERRKRASEKRDTEAASPPRDDSRGLSGAPRPIPVEELMAIVPRALAGDPETYAVTFFMSTYANPAMSNIDRKDFLGYIAPQYAAAGPDSVLRMATMAMSTFLFVAWLDRRPDTITCRSFYLKALSALKERLARQEGCTDNDVLTSVLLLQLYEVSISRYAPENGETNVEKRLFGVVSQSKPWRAHLDGALALVKHRGVENFKDEVGQGLLFAVRSQLIEESFSTGQNIAEDVSAWSSSCPISPSSLLDSINVDVANLAVSASKHAALPLYIRSKNPNKTEELLCQAQDIERKLLKWSASVPSSWFPVHVSSEAIHPAIIAAGVYQDYCNIYANISVSSTWNKYRMALIRTSLIISSLLPLLLPSNATLSTIITTQGIIQQMTDDICASIPFTLGDKVKPTSMGDRKVLYPCVPGGKVSDKHYQMAPALGGFWLLAPLQMLMGLDEGEMGMRRGQKAWIGGQLRRIARIYNIGK